MGPERRRREDPAPKPRRLPLLEKITGIERATQDALRTDLKSLFQGAIRLTLEMVLEEELKAMVGARLVRR